MSDRRSFLRGLTTALVAAGMPLDGLVKEGDVPGTVKVPLKIRHCFNDEPYHVEVPMPNSLEAMVKVLGEENVYENTLQALNFRSLLFLRKEMKRLLDKGETREQVQERLNELAAGYNPRPRPRPDKVARLKQPVLSLSTLELNPQQIAVLEQYGIKVVP